MNRVFVHGCGVVSPAGWGLPAFREVLDGHRTPAPTRLTRPDGAGLDVFRVPAPAVRPTWLGHPRLRRSSVISHHAVAAAIEAMGDGRPAQSPGLAIVVCVMGGSVLYSRRFFAEVLAEPTTASPLLFPETVFNAPASHLGAVLGTGARNSTHVSDQTGFIAGLAVAADWLARDVAQSCLVVACEEADWTTAEALRLFPGNAVPSEGAAAVLLRREPGPVELTGISSPRPYIRGRHAATELDAVRRELGAVSRVVCHGVPGTEGALEHLLGDGLAASGGWTCVAAIDAILHGQAASASALVAGTNLQAIGASFGRTSKDDLTLLRPRGG